MAPDSTGRTSSNDFSTGASPVKTWLKSLLHKDCDRQAADSTSTGQANMSPPASADMISFHHTMEDEDDRPSFLPPPRSFSGGSGSTSFASAAQRTLAQPAASPSLFRSRSSDSAEGRDATARSQDPSNSPSRTIAQGVSSLSSIFQHQRRASSAFRQMRSGSSQDKADLIASTEKDSDRLPSSEPRYSFGRGAYTSGPPAIDSTPQDDRLEASRPFLASKRSSSFGEKDDTSQLLLPEGEHMLKVTHKKVKSRTFRLDADRGQILWESKRNTIVNLESIREVRFGPSAASYRTSLNISSAHEPRWITIIYQNVGIYKALHLIALSDASVVRWRASLLHLQTLRRELTGSAGASGSLEHRRMLWMRHQWKSADQSNDERLSVEEVMQLCRRLGIESNKAHLRKCFNVADYRNRGYLDFEDFQYFVSLLKRRADVQLVFDTWAEYPDRNVCNTINSGIGDPTVGQGITEASFKKFLRIEQGNLNFTDDQIHDLFVRHCHSRLTHVDTQDTHVLMDYEGFLDFLASSDNPPLTDQLPLFSTMVSDVGDADEDTSSAAKVDEAKDESSSLSPHFAQSLSVAQQGTPSRAFANTAEELIAAGPSTSHATTRKVAAHLRKSTVQQDMKRPLSEYYISSSHNTYLVGGQWKGDSTVEGYIRALLQGARSVELDCWDGPNLTPQITHGRTLTSRVAFQDVISAIARYAFVSSPYPLILSLEVHAEPAQQDVMARILVDTLGELLLSHPLGDSKAAPLQEDDLPSPEDLRFKVLVKAKNVLLTESDAKLTHDSGGRTVLPVIESATSTSATETSATDSDTDAHSVSGAKGLVGRLTRRNKANMQRPQSNRALSDSGRKDSKRLMSTALASLLVYTIGVKCRGLNKKETYATQHMISLSEKSAIKFIQDMTVRESLIKHNRTHLTRVYPSMTSFARLHASRNFVPLDMWASGCQLAALNWQTADLGFELNQAMFSRNGRCGYVLKPAALRLKDRMKTDVARSLRFSLDLRVISAQQLPKKKADASKEKDGDQKEPINPFVSVSLIAPKSWGRQPRGLLRQRDSACTKAIADAPIVDEPNGDADAATEHSDLFVECSQLRTHTIRGNGFSPQWDTLMNVQIEVPAGLNSEADSIVKETHSKADIERLSRGLLDLCFIRFEVFDDDLESDTGNKEASAASEAASDSKTKDAVPSSTTLPKVMSSNSTGAGLNLINSTNEASTSSSSSTSSIEADCVAAFAVSIGALQQGYRHLPLYDHQLSQYLFSTLFVRSRLRFVGIVNKST